MVRTTLSGKEGRRVRSYDPSVCRRNKAGQLDHREAIQMSGSPLGRLCGVSALSGEGSVHPS